MLRMLLAAAWPRLQNRQRARVHEDLRPDLFQADEDSFVLQAAEFVGFHEVSGVLPPFVLVTNTSFSLYIF